MVGSLDLQWDLLPGMSEPQPAQPVEALAQMVIELVVMYKEQC